MAVLFLIFILVLALGMDSANSRGLNDSDMEDFEVDPDAGSLLDIVEDEEK